MQRLVRQNLMRRRWTRNPKEVKKLKKVKFAVETMEIEPYDAKIKNESKDAKLRQQNGRELRMDKLWNQKYRTFRFGRGWNFAARVKDQKSRAKWSGDFYGFGGTAVFLDRAIPPLILTNCSSHTESLQRIGSHRWNHFTDDYMCIDNDYMYIVTTCVC